MKRLVFVWMLLLLCFLTCALAEEGAPEALVRGNTAVVRVSDAWLRDYARAQNPPENHSFPLDSNQSTVDDAWLRQNLSEADYTAFMQRHAQGGYADHLMISSFSAVADPTSEKSNRLVMNERRLGDDWYLIFRQKPISFDAACCYRHACVYYDTRAFSLNPLEHIQHAETKIPQERISVSKYDGGTEKQLERGEQTIELFPGLGASIAVITIACDKDDFMERAVLMLGGEAEIDVMGYMEDGHAIYCCVLSDLERQRIEDGASVYLVPRF